MTRFYAIGDIHGRFSLLERAHELIQADQAREGVAPVIHLGDLPDRGPRTRGVIDFVMQGIDEKSDWIVLKGNHDRMFSLFLDDPTAQDAGLPPQYDYLHPALGGVETLASYGVARAADRPRNEVHAEAVAAVPAAHRAFLASRPVTWRAGDCLFVHAGIRPGRPLEEQTEDDLVWIREPFLSDRRDHGVLVVHGHTTLDRATHYGNRLNIDSGAGYGGPLTAVAIEGRRAWILTGKGRQPLPETPIAENW